MSTWHVYPTGDLIEHETEGDGCACGPATKPVQHENGSIGWILVHHSLDNRELKETR